MELSSPQEFRKFQSCLVRILITFIDRVLQQQKHRFAQPQLCVNYTLHSDRDHGCEQLAQSRLVI